MIRILISKFSDKKEFLLTTLFLFVASLLIILGLYSLSYYENLINVLVSKKDENRIISVDYYESYSETEVEKLLNLEHVDYGYEKYGNWVLEHDYDCAMILVNSYESEQIIKSGRNIENDYEILIPVNLVSENEIDVGKKITVNNGVELSIVGIVSEYGNYIYTNTETLREIANENNGLVAKINLIIDEYKNIDSVIEEIGKLGYSAEKKENLDNEVNEIEKIIEAIKFGIYLVVLISGILLFYAFRYINKNNQKNKALLKLFGYSNIFVNFIEFIYELVITIIVMFSTLLLYLIIYCIFSLLNIYVVSLIDFIYILLFVFVLSILIMLLSFFFSLFSYRKIDMLNVIEEN